MKKYFIFAALVTAGLLTSCSSSDDIVANDVPEVPTVSEGDLVPIKLNVAQFGTVTRGTGTVGGLVKSATDDTPVNNDGSELNAPANSWAGQKVNVYMFKTYDTNTSSALTTLEVATFENPDGTFNKIYENAELTTPATGATGTASYLTGATANEDADQQPINPAQATRYVKYYPMKDRFDFAAYRIDAAAPAPAPAFNAAHDSLSVTFATDGSQDVLAAQTYVNTWANMSDGEKNVFVGADATEKQASYNAAVPVKYSASAARKGLQPNLLFKHMLTRMTFEAKAGDAASENVYVRGIKVRPIHAFTAADNNANPAVAADTTWIDPTNIKLNFASSTTGFEPSVDYSYVTTSAASQANKPAPLVLMKRNPAAGTTANDPLVALVDANDNVPATNGSVVLTNTYTNDEYASIGEAIIAPTALGYELEIQLVQKVVTVETINGTAVTREDYNYGTVKYIVKSDANDPFKAEYSYNFRITAYGLKRIDISTTLEAWKFGENVPVDTDN